MYSTYATYNSIRTEHTIKFAYKKGQPTVRLSTPTTRACTRVVAVAVLHEYTALHEKVLVRNYTHRTASHPRHTIARVGVSSGSPISSRSMRTNTSLVCPHTGCCRFRRAGVFLSISTHERAAVGLAGRSSSSPATSTAAPCTLQVPTPCTVGVGAGIASAGASGYMSACRGAIVMS
jgi:hypothetical protein